MELGGWYDRFASVYDASVERVYAPYRARIAAALQLSAGQRVLDVACGAGRYSRALAARGLKVTGIDLSTEMLEEARARSPNLPGMPLYLRWDARALPFREQFEGAVSLFTSLGYGDTRQDDLRILRGVERALVPGGRFLLDYLHAAEVRGHLVAEEQRTVSGLEVTLRRRIDEGAADGPQVVKRVEARLAGTDRIEAAFTERVRLYAPEGLDALLREAGLEPVGERHGDLDGSPFGPASPRCVRVARKSG